MALTSEENTLITDYMYLAEREACRQLSNFSNRSFGYGELCSIGYLAIIEAVSSGKYKNARSLEGYLTKCIRNNITIAIRASEQYVLVEDQDYLDSIATTPDDSTGFDYDKAKDALIFLSPEEQKILRYKYKNGLTLDEISERLSVSPATIDNKVSKIKKKLKSEVL